MPKAPNRAGVQMPRFKSINEVLDFAIARESESHAFYLDLGKQVSKPDLRRAVEGFAADELQHGLRLQAIKAGETGFVAEEVGSLDIAESVGEVQPRPDMSYADLLAVGMKKEQAAFRLYTNLASIARTMDLRQVLLGLAQEEAQHKLRLEIEYDWATF
jgi:rubrerythrin